MNKEPDWEEIYDALCKNALDVMHQQPTTPPPLWIKSSEIRKLKLYWWNPLSVFRYWRARHNVMKSMPISNPYPEVRKTTYINNAR